MVRSMFSTPLTGYPGESIASEIPFKQCSFFRDNDERTLENWLIYDTLILANQKEVTYMVGATATATEMQNNFGRYLNIVIGGKEVIVTKNGKEVGRFIPRDAAVSYLTDSLAGILKGNSDIDQAKEERLNEKYASID